MLLASTEDLGCGRIMIIVNTGVSTLDCCFLAFGRLLGVQIFIEYVALIMSLL